MEEKKNIIADAGMELTDDELESVAGGSSMITFTCKRCNAIIHIKRGLSTFMCPQCYVKYNLNG